MENPESISGYKWPDTAPTDAHRFLLPRILSILSKLEAQGVGRSVMDLGCGNGSVTSHLHDLGYDIVGIDPSDEGVKMAKSHYPHLRIEQGSTYENLTARRHALLSYILSADLKASARRDLH